METPSTLNSPHQGMKVSYLFFFMMGVIGLSGSMISNVPLMLIGIALGVTGVFLLPKQDGLSPAEDLARLRVKEMADAMRREQERECRDQAKYAEWVRFAAQYRLQFREENYTEWLSHNLQHTMEKEINE